MRTFSAVSGTVSASRQSSLLVVVGNIIEAEVCTHAHDLVVGRLREKVSLDLGGVLLDGWTVYRPKNMYEIDDYAGYLDIDTSLPVSYGRYCGFVTHSRTTLKSKRGYQINPSRVGLKL